MKRIVCGAAAIIGLLTLPALADPLEGQWQTEVDDGAYAIIEISPCGEALCGVMVRSLKENGDEYRSPNLGRQIVIDMVPRGEGRYNGKVWRPSNDRIYIGKMRLRGDSVRLRGCVAGGLLCSGQTWQRAN